ncbi:hypothetical protein CBOM_07397 [Ceraceosorus bombacis]|uniref:Uncharacterized protein n=1 Tax=Ceraceosorus bombacis TaxID=401625 RepID=A0A0P1BBF1_9BASI|nr:hypothetical protein CBOM_07397 [Ceraceosorus bombacis]
MLLAMHPSKNLPGSQIRPSLVARSHSNEGTVRSCEKGGNDPTRQHVDFATKDFTIRHASTKNFILRHAVSHCTGQTGWGGDHESARVASKPLQVISRRTDLAPNHRVRPSSCRRMTGLVKQPHT